MDSFRKYSFEFSFTLCKTYTRIASFYNKYIHIWVISCCDPKLDLNQDFYNFYNSPMYINHVIGDSDTYCSMATRPLDFSPCEFSFLNITLNFDGKEYDIDIGDKDHNFYCINNVIDFNYIYWYMSYVNRVKKFNKDYTCVILDNSYNFVEFGHNDIITLHSNSYTLAKID